MQPLLVRFGGLGDMVLITVAVQALHQRFGQPVDILGREAWTRPLLEGQPGVGKVYVIGSRRLPIWTSVAQWQIIQRLKHRGAGPTWIFDAETRMVKRLLHLAGWRSEQMMTLDCLADIAGEHFCDRWRRFAELDLNPEAVGSDFLVSPAMRNPEAAAPTLQVTAQAKADAEEFLAGLGLTGRPLILIQIGNKRTMHRGNIQRDSNKKYWPEERWAAVLRTLRVTHPQHAILMLGVGRETTLNERILSLSGGTSAFNLASQMTVPRLMALSKIAAGMISVDTGPAHVAAALGCPTLVLYTCPSTKGIYGTRSTRSAVFHLIGGADENPSLMGISQEQVIEGWSEMTRGIMHAQDRESSLAVFA